MPPITQETFAWLFKDPEWKTKFLIGSLFILAGTFIPIIGWLGYFAVYGYCLIMVRAVIRGDAPALPTWDRFGELFVDGFKSGLAAIGYLLPGIIAMFCAYGSMFGAIMVDVIVSATARRGSAFFPPAFLIGYAGFFLFFAVAMVLFLVTVIPMAIAVGQYARTGEIGAGYRFDEVWRILRANVGGFVIALFMSWAIAIGLSLLLQIVYFTIILCCLLPFLMAPISFYMTVMWAYLFGMAYREGSTKAGISIAAIE